MVGHFSLPIQCPEFATMLKRRTIDETEATTDRFVWLQWCLIFSRVLPCQRTVSVLDAGVYVHLRIFQSRLLVIRYSPNQG